MDIKERSDELGNQLLTFYIETKMCIKLAQTHEERLAVRELLNALALFHGNLEEYYKHPENIDDLIYQ